MSSLPARRSSDLDPSQVMAAAALENGHAPPGHRDLADPVGGHASALRWRLLVLLRQLGPESPDRLAAELRLSRTGVLQQLRTLEQAGLVTRQTLRHGVGRPRHLYDVTESAQELLPANYDALSAGLLDAIADVGGDELIEAVFQARRRRLTERLREHMARELPPDASLPDRVRQLAVLQDQQGYLCHAFIGSDGAPRLAEHNCAILHAASSHRAACDAELELFEAVLGASVVRESHILAGDRCCSYRIVDGRTS